MIQIYADGVLTYDSRLEEYSLLGLKVTPGVNKGGSAELIMPPEHPAYNRYISYKTIVEIYKDSVLLFRGRSLYPTDNFYNQRTITCEGELCFTQDAIMRPYDYRDSPDNIFTAVISTYNSQVEPAKQFQVGTITVTDPNNYIRIYSETAEQVQDLISKLVERVGGYIVFTTNGSNQRVINWYADLTYRSDQTIEFGENLLSFSRSDSNDDLATVIVPYGAKQDDGTRVDIKSVNGGLDYIQDSDAVALRGRITRPVYWDDVTLPANLLAKAQQYLASSKLILTSLELTAVDLSNVDKSIDQFQVGDNIRVISVPHGVDDWFQLTEMTIDLLHPESSTVSLGKTYSSLSGASVSSDRSNKSAIVETVYSAISGYDVDVSTAIAETSTTLSSLIQQTSDAIQYVVSQTYATNDDLQSAISTQVTQLANSITLHFTQIRAVVDDNDAEARAQFEELRRYIRFEDGNIILGETGNEITLKIENDRLAFLSGGVEVAYFSNRRLYVTDGEFLQSLKLGKFAFMPRSNGNLSFKKVVS